MNKILCERCQAEEANSISFFNIRPSCSENDGEVIFAGMCTADEEEYYITLDRINERWLAHLRGKRWFTPSVEAQFRDRVFRLGKDASEMLLEEENK